MVAVTGHWKHKIVFVLKTRAGANDDVVQGRLCAPAHVSSTSGSQSEREKYTADLEKYEKANNEAMTVLTNTLEDEVLHKVIRFQHARELWLELHGMYEPSSESRLSDLCAQFFTLSCEKGEGMVSYLSRVKNMWSEINQGFQRIQVSTLPDLLLISRIISGLPSE